MKSNGRGGVAGNAKLRGKTTKMLSCKCCDLRNFCWHMRVKEAIKEIREYQKENYETK